jgi:hypothetical protein
MTNKGLTPEQLNRAESRLARLDGVLACRIKVGPAGQVEEVEIDAERDAEWSDIAAEAESILRDEFRQDVSAAQIQVSPAREPAPSGVEEFPILEYASRFAFVSVNVVSSRDGIRAEVELSRDGATAFGAAATGNIAAPAWAVVSDATLRAVSEFLDGATRLCLIGVVKAPLGDREAVLVRVDVVSSRCTKSLAGCALVDGNENQSVVFATLDAVNRVTGKLDYKTSIEYKIT